MFRFIYVIITNLFRAPYIITKMRYMADHYDKYSEQERYNFAKQVIRYMTDSGKIDTQSFGMENLPQYTGYIMTPNHQGKYDVLGIITAHERPCSLVMDISKSNTILVSEFVDLLKGKRMDINDVRQAMKIIHSVSKEVKNGKKYILFPEGGYEFNNRNHMKEFKAGSFKAAVVAKVPIVPVAIIDSYKVFNSFKIGRVITQVHFLEPLYYEDYKGLRTPDIAAVVKSRIEEKIKEVKMQKIQRLF